MHVLNSNIFINLSKDKSLQDMYENIHSYVQNLALDYKL